MVNLNNITSWVILGPGCCRTEDVVDVVERNEDMEREVVMENKKEYLEFIDIINQISSFHFY